MTQAQFEQLVRDMRAAQREYFRYRTQDALRRSKELEQKVDDWLFCGGDEKHVLTHADLVQIETEVKNSKKE